ncbi:hypothetical protein BGW36DRAFT_41965 [Talaromyces proteolyticus]|uniref:Uncharacterized protein n=1 Tax=Talaromyces proteolyticus TaxID=1131652 RepID=A0AAD4PUE0_9EURO|nr:uncharacterized protein BGW36DRAFT_41965 [Talaromyces proteolyticus]KAH8692110.1 hypothetical protein BGW36DRAFT_41965 [Talaromyces proteolyticus]
MSGKQYITFSSSLQRRSVWSVLHPVLDVAPNITLEESSDKTYDLAFCLFDGNHRHEMRAILFTPCGLEEDDRQATLTRVEKFASLISDSSSNQYLAIIFLHSNKAFPTASGRFNFNGLISLQVLLLHSPNASNLPIISAAEPSTLLASVKEHCKARACGPVQPPMVSSQSPLFLLERVLASGSSQLHQRHNLNVLSDLFPTLRELSRATRTLEGRQLIIEYLGEEVEESIQAFWSDEWVCG